MAVRIGSLFVSLGVDTGPYATGMQRAARTTTAATGAMRRDVGLTTRSVTQLRTSLGARPRMSGFIAASRQFDTMNDRANLLRASMLATTAVFTGFAAALGTNLLARYADTFTNLQNQIRVVSRDQADLTAQTYAVAEAANAARSGLRETATLYSRLRKAAPTRQAQEILQFTETIQKALQLGGATAQEAASAAIQFSQAIASNRLGGEELRAILETPLGLGLAKGLGVTIGKLREMSIAGELTADVLLGALQKIGPSINQQFSQSVRTIDQALTVFDNMATLAVADLDQTYGASKNLSAGIVGLANNLDTLIPLLLQVGGLAVAAFAGRVISKPFAGGAGRFRRELEQRRQLLEEAKKARDALGEELVSTGQARAGLTRSTFGDTFRFAGGELRKEVERGRHQLQKLDERHLKLVEARGEATRKLGQIESQVSTKAIRLADQQFAAEKRLGDLVASRAGLRQRLQQAQTRATALSGQQAVLGIDPRQLREAEKAVQQAGAAVVRNERAIATERDRMKLAQVQRVRELTAADLAASDQRITALRKVDEIDRQISASADERVLTQQIVRKQYAEAQAEGFRNASRSANEADQAYKSVQTRFIATNTQVTAFTRAATVAAVGMTTLRAAGASLVGFLGGPWGVAFTGAIVLLGVLGSRAAAESQRVAQAQEIISRRLGDLAKAGGEIGEAAQASIEQERLKALQDELAAVREQMHALNIEIGQNPLFGGGPAERQFLIRQEFAEGAEQVRQLVEQFQDGAIDANRFASEMDKIGLANPRFAELVETTKQSEINLDRAAQAATSLQASITRLERDVTITVTFRAIEDASMRSLRSMIASDTLGAANETAFGDIRREELARAADDKTQALLDRAASLARANQGINASMSDWLSLAADVIAEEEATAAARKESTKATNEATRAAKQYANFLEKLERLRQEGRASLLGDLDQAVIQEANDLKAATELVKAYTDAVLSGDLSNAPKELLQIREALLQKNAGQSLQGILQQYGTGIQLAGQLADKQAELNYLVAQGAITADQAALAYADFLGQFANYAWIGEVSSAVTGFADAAITDFENIGDAWETLLKRMVQIALQHAFLTPVENAIKRLLSSISGAGGGGGGFFGFLASLFSSGLSAAPAGTTWGVTAGLHHAGGIAGFGPKRRVPGAIFAAAERYHGGGMAGLRSGEVPAILRKGEPVFPSLSAARDFGGSFEPGDVNVPVNVSIVNRNDSDVSVRQGGPDGRDLEIMVENKVMDLASRGKLHKPMGLRRPMAPLG